jgi:hypothetical protein
MKRCSLSALNGRLNLLTSITGNSGGSWFVVILFPIGGNAEIHVKDLVIPPLCAAVYFTQFLLVGSHSMLGNANHIPGVQGQDIAQLCQVRPASELRM